MNEMSQSNVIPHDIILSAVLACKVKGILGNERTVQKLVESVAKAILAERRNCAKIAEDYANRAMNANPSAQEAYAAAASISQAILNQSNQTD